MSAIDQRPTPAPGDQTPASGPGAAGSVAPPPVARTLALLAADGVAYLVYWLVILILLSQAATSVLRPPEGSVTVP